MTGQEYIISQLSALKESEGFVLDKKENSEMLETVVKFLFSKKFRKFSIPEPNQKIIKEAIAKNIADGKPIQISWPFGGYKLWRLEEAPEADWAELFTIMYIVKWLKPICSIYSHGVIFTFWLDEVVISKMNNIPQSDIDAYQKSFKLVLDFVKPLISENMKFEVFLERSQYLSTEVFEKGLAIEMEKLAKVRLAQPLMLSDGEKQSIELNVKLTPDQGKDPLWREKIDLMHNAYYILQEKQNHVRPSYTKENITAFSTFFQPNVIPIGTTKTSVAKFWVGVGALIRRNDDYIETVLSPSQIEKSGAIWEDVVVKGLEGKNFSRIRVI
jgi:hypothetical protein